jgi:hypothetical protein
LTLDKLVQIVVGKHAAGPLGPATDDNIAERAGLDVRFESFARASEPGGGFIGFKQF